MEKVILVGRHAPIGLPDTIEVVEQREINFALTPDDCQRQWISLMEDAAAKKCGVLLQNTPGILFASVMRLLLDGTTPHVKVGVIISEPDFANRKRAEKTFAFSTEADSATAASAVTFANGRASASVEGANVTVGVDPVTPFKFHSIVWINDDDVYHAVITDGSEVVFGDLGMRFELDSEHEQVFAYAWNIANDELEDPFGDLEVELFDFSYEKMADEGELPRFRVWVTQKQAQKALAAFDDMIETLKDQANEEF